MKYVRNYFLIAICIGAVLVFAVTPKTEKMGDRLQYALPIAGLVCSLDLKEAGSYFTRYAAGLATVHIFKNTLPQKGVFARPGGGGAGFPSGHTFSASYGASYIARQCGSKIPYIGPIVVVAAGFTAITRVNAPNPEETPAHHNPWQVLFGAILALFFDRALQGEKSKVRRKARLKSVGNFVKARFSK